MVYRINVDDAFLNGLNALSVDSFTLDTTMIGKGGAWQVFCSMTTAGQWCCSGNALSSYNDGTHSKT